VALECWHLPIAFAAAPPLRTEVGQWLREAPGAGAVVVLPLGLDIDSTPAMVQSLEHRRALLNGYSGQRPSFYVALVDALTTFPSEEALLALHESGVQYVVAPPTITGVVAGADSPLVPRARFADATIYELEWTSAIEERFTRLTTVVPPAPGTIPFAAGEQARYTVTWDGPGVHVAAGEVTLSVEAPAYRLIATATTAPWVARFFEAQDRFTTTTDSQLLPLVHERAQNEGSRHVTRVFVYDWDAHVVRTGQTAEQARAPEAVALPLMPSARDAIAALFYVRTLPLEPGTGLRFPVNEAGRSLIVNVRVGVRERISVQGAMVDAIRLDPTMEQRVTRRAAAVATVWLSADARRVPLAVDVVAAFGRIRMELSRYEP
jgi:hypothetical protein